MGTLSTRTVCLVAFACGMAFARPSTGRADPTTHRTTSTVPAGEDATRTRRHLAMPIGLSVGFRGDGETRAALVGGELSLVWYTPDGSMLHGPLDGSFAFGFVLEGTWVTDPSHFRATLAPEVMWAFGGNSALGLEAGPTLHSRGDLVGFRTRAFLTSYVATFYVGLDYHGRVGAELGLLLKVPIRLR